MKIAKTESIYLSVSEANIFEEMIHILDGLVKDCNDPTHRKTAEEARNKFYKVLEMVDEVYSEGDDCE